VRGPTVTVFEQRGSLLELGVGTRRSCGTLAKGRGRGIRGNLDGGRGYDGMGRVLPRGGGGEGGGE